MEETFNYFTHHTGIELPKNILKNYSKGKNNKSEFVRLFKSNVDSIKKGSSATLSVLISEKFVLEILKIIDRIPKQVRYNILFEKLEMYDKSFYNKKRMIPSLDSEKLIIEEVLCYLNDYDFKANRFKFPLIQEAYENLNSNYNEMKVILILYGDCGGEGGIIVRGKNVGFDSGYPHGESSEIKFNGEIIEYDGYFFENHERLHKPIIENFKH
jgi:hypothetical protein